MSQDRSDIQYAVKELSRGMASPTKLQPFINNALWAADASQIEAEDAE